MAGFQINLYANGANTGNDADYSNIYGRYWVAPGYPLPNPETEFGWVYSGYTFSHWNYDANDTNTSFQVGDTGFESNLYAIWTPAGGVQ